MACETSPVPTRKWFLQILMFFPVKTIPLEYSSAATTGLWITKRWIDTSSAWISMFGIASGN